MYCLEAGKHLVKFGWGHGFSKVAAMRHKPLLKTWLLGGILRGGSNDMVFAKAGLDSEPLCLLKSWRKSMMPFSAKFLNPQIFRYGNMCAG